MIQFDNTEIAFRNRSDRELLFAYWLFKIMGNSSVVQTGKFFTNLAIRLHIPIAWIVKPTIYRHFCGGETIEESIPVIRKIEKSGVKGILDYSVEGKESPEDIQAALDETLRTVVNAGQDPNIHFSVFKPSAFIPHRVLDKIGNGESLTDEEEQEKQRFKDRVHTLFKTAYDHDIPIMIDAEESWYQSFVDDVVRENMVLFNKKKAIVYNTLQMYRRDRLDFLKQEYQKAKEGNYYLGIKFVRGAYMERERARAEQMGYPDPINPDKEATDKMYDDGLRFTVDHLDRIAVFNGTHNENSNRLLCTLIDEKGIARDDPRIWFSQLFGMSDHVSYNLAAAGFNVTKYLPYGPVNHVLSYLIRRTEENTAVAGQTTRELKLVVQERKRRKAARHQ
ncbi:MAG: proline dehydrogenase family protein [Bacteroidales bacterium]|nr:proline dehydrogenase family protein [Bacteroidales bacterium]